MILGTALFLAVFSFFFIVTGSYHGLGKRLGVPRNDLSNRYYQQAGGFLSYTGPGFSSVPGVDVSEYQKTIDWESAAASGIRFAMIRLGYRGSQNGALTEDPMAAYNLRKAKAAGLETGVYFYSQARNVDEAVEEAKFVVRKIRGRGVTYPVAFDMEVSENDRNGGLSVRQRTEIADAFCSIIAQNGYTPMIYGNPTWLNGWIDMSYLAKYDVWLAHYTGRTSYRGRYRMWQYSDRGRVAGIPVSVDLNVRILPKK